MGVEQRAQRATLGAVMVLACIWPTTSLAQGPHAPGFENEPTGFGGLAWRTRQASVKGLVEDSSIVGGKCYTRTGDDRKAYGLVADKVRYCFVSGQLQSVTLVFGEPAGKRRSREAWEQLKQAKQRHYDQLAPAMRKRHGPPTSTHGDKYWAKALHWSGRASAVLNPYCCGVEVVLMDHQRALKRFQAGADFGERATRALERCWKEHRTWPGTEAAFADWMAREGKAVVASWSFQEDGSVLIEPKGGALFVIAARGLPPRPPTKEALERRAATAKAEAGAEEWARHVDALFALIGADELMLPRRPRHKFDCQGGCMRQVAAAKPVPKQVGTWLKKCTQDCVEERQAAARQVCEEKIGKVKDYLATHGEQMRELAGDLPLFASQVSSRTRKLQRILNGMERRCPAQVAKFQALTKPVWYRPPKD